MIASAPSVSPRSMSCSVLVVLQHDVLLGREGLQRVLAFLTLA